MHAVIRRYNGRGATELFQLLEKRTSEIEGIIRKVPGLISYTLIRDGAGGASVTVCESREGCEKSMKLSRDWIAEHAGNLGIDLPEVTEGGTLIHIN